jgi:hypothetical protein
MFIIHLLLFVLVLLFARMVFVWFSPHRTCLWCRGERRRCWRCKGSGETWRPGARLVRRAHVAAHNAWTEWRYR